MFFWYFMNVNGFVLMGFWFSCCCVLVVFSWFVYLVERIDVKFIVRFVRIGVVGCFSVSLIV